MRLPDFLQQKLKPKIGSVVEIKDDATVYDHILTDTQLAESDISGMLERISEPFHYQRKDGKKLGDHRGAHYFTIGQRKGLTISGTPLP